MRKIEKLVVDAIRSGRGFSRGNTSLTFDPEGKKWYLALHGNLIATGEKGHYASHVALVGWNSATTRSRLRAVGASIWQIRGVPYLVDGTSKREVPLQGWMEV